MWALWGCCSQPYRRTAPRTSLPYIQIQILPPSHPPTTLIQIPPKLLLFMLFDIFLGFKAFQNPKLGFNLEGLRPRRNVDVCVGVRARAGVGFSYEMRSEWIPGSLSLGEDVRERWACWHASCLVISDGGRCIRARAWADGAVSSRSTTSSEPLALLALSISLFTPPPER